MPTHSEESPDVYGDDVPFPIPLQIVMEDFRRRFETFIVIGVPRPDVQMGDTGKFAACEGNRAALVYEMHCILTQLALEEIGASESPEPVQEPETESRENSSEDADDPMEVSEWSEIQRRVSDTDPSIRQEADE